MLGRIWADIAAAAVVGTKGVHNLRGQAQGDGGTNIKVAVRPVVRKIKYHLPYAIPAIVLLVGCIGVLVATLVMSLLRRSSLERMRVGLRRTAVGRVLVLLLEEENGIHVSDEKISEGLMMGEKEWSVKKGGIEVDLGMRGTIPAPGPGVEDGSEGTLEDNKPSATVVVTPQPQGGTGEMPVSPVSTGDERRGGPTRYW